jgi:hypothetical protein
MPRNSHAPLYWGRQAHSGHLTFDYGNWEENVAVVKVGVCCVLFIVVVVMAIGCTGGRLTCGPVYGLMVSISFKMIAFSPNIWALQMRSNIIKMKEVF